MIAIYARQSVDKKDSISIESQIEACRRKLQPSEEQVVRVYSDKGFSGKSTNRPEFQNLIDDINSGLVEKILVYKLDRISRSLLDFLKMQEEFTKHDVKFVSCQEDFDTSTSTGKMMMNILMMFAEMEREAIQKRITDNYYARGEKGYYLGGHAPFGYNKIETVLNSKKTYTFEIEPLESEIVKSIYVDFALNYKSLNEIARRLNADGVKTIRGKCWNMQGVSRTLHNPIYVKANADVYNYLKSKGATMNNPIDDYNGIYGCYLYGNTKNRKSNKFIYIDTDYVTLGLHEGFIESELWLLAQNRFKTQNTNRNLGTGKLSWAQGLVRCKFCGYSCYVKKCKNYYSDKVFMYYYCRGKRNGECRASTKMLKVEVLESILERAILEHLKVEQYTDSVQEINNNNELNLMKINVDKIDARINELVSQIGSASKVTMKYVNEELERLDKQKNQIYADIHEFQMSKTRLSSALDIDEIVNDWSDYSIEQKSIIAKSIVKCIEVDGEEIKILF